MNLYGYAEGDPLNGSDPFGLTPIWERFASALSAVDVTVANKQSWDSVSTNVLFMIKLAAVDAGVRSVGVSWTTGGKHGALSSHYPRNNADADGLGLAADIYSVDGMLVGSKQAQPTVAAYQGALERTPLKDRNFGPGTMRRGGRDLCATGGAQCLNLKAGHKRHIHYSTIK